MARIALVLVSHSAKAAEGTAEVARQMAPDVDVVPAGGTDEGIGTSVDRVLAALEDVLERFEGAVVLTDLGSAVLTTEAVLEMLDDGADRVRVPSAPFVEAAVAAAVEAQQGGDLAGVTSAAQRAGAMFGPTDAAPGDADPASGGPVPATGDPSAREAAPSGPEVSATAVLGNRLGLHARPAALLARTVADSGARVTIDGVDGASVLALMGLGAVGGRELTIGVSGPGAEQVLATLVGMVTDGFGES